ncbi:MAG TPA: hypothetical protein VIK75_05365 [Calditerricola sp.]
MEEGGFFIGRESQYYRIPEYGRIYFDLKESLVLNTLATLNHPQLFDVRVKRDQLEVQVKQFIGILPLTRTIVLEIVPRVPVNNLSRLLEMSKWKALVLRDRYRRYETTAEGEGISVIDLVVEQFIEKVRELLLVGLHGAYQPVDAVTSFPRGRILIGPTINRCIVNGRYYPVHVRWFERTTDNDLNRYLKLALWYCSEVYRNVRRHGARRIAAEINRLLHAFEGVTLDVSLRRVGSSLLDCGEYRSLRGVYYVDAIRLADVLLNQREIQLEDDRGEVVLPSLLIDMEEVFEDYVLGILTKWEHGSLRVLDGRKSGRGYGGKRLYDIGPEESANPDCVITDDNSEYKAIIEVKYTPASNTPSREHINQVVTYAVSYRVDKAIIVQPCREEKDSGLEYVGRINFIDLFWFKWFLGASDIRVEEERFIRSIAEAVTETDSALRVGKSWMAAGAKGRKR